MKKTFWSLGLALAALVVIAPRVIPAEEAGDLPAVQATASEAVASPAEAAELDFAAGSASTAATPVSGAAETLDLERMACNPPECTTSADCGGGRCRAKCCV